MSILLKAKEGLVPIKKRTKNGSWITFYVKPKKADQWMKEGNAELVDTTGLKYSKTKNGSMKIDKEKPKKKINLDQLSKMSITELTELAGGNPYKKSPLLMQKDNLIKDITRNNEKKLPPFKDSHVAKLDKYRKALEDAVWKKTHKDFKSTTYGRSIMMMTAQGSQVIPLSEIKKTDLEARLNPSDLQALKDKMGVVDEPVSDSTPVSDRDPNFNPLEHQYNLLDQHGTKMEELSNIDQQTMEDFAYEYRTGQISKDLLTMKTNKLLSKYSPDGIIARTKEHLDIKPKQIGAEAKNDGILAQMVAQTIKPTVEKITSPKSKEKVQRWTEQGLNNYHSTNSKERITARNNTNHLANLLGHDRLQVVADAVGYYWAEGDSDKIALGDMMWKYAEGGKQSTRGTTLKNAINSMLEKDIALGGASSKATPIGRTQLDDELDDKSFWGGKSKPSITDVLFKNAR